MVWTVFDSWIVLIAILSALCCALPGNFLVLRRLSMLGDAISHAVLPGIALAFIFTQSRSSPVMFIGAVASGVVVAVLSRVIHRRGRIEEGAALGAVFSIMFALGLVFIVQGADAVDLDPSCVLYGALELAPLDSVDIAGFAVPRSLPRLLAMLAVNIIAIVLCYKELEISSFDPDFATNTGIRTSLLHYLFIALIATTTVAVFELVGSIIVIAMLVAPAATASLLTNRLRVMIAISAVVAVISAVMGYLAAILIPPLFGVTDTNAAGAVAAVAGFIFIVTLVSTRALGRARRRRSLPASDSKVRRVSPVTPQL